MKKILLLSSIFSILLFSCKEEKDEKIGPVTQASTVTGKWLATNRHYYYYDSLNLQVQEAVTGWGGHSIEFISPATLNETLPAANKVISGNFSLNSNKLTVTFPPGVLEQGSVFFEHEPNVSSISPLYIDSLTTNRFILRDTAILSRRPGDPKRYRVSILTLKK